MLIDTEYKLVSPLLKWAGGKTQLLPKLFCHFPKQINMFELIAMAYGGSSLTFTYHQSYFTGKLNKKKHILHKKKHR